MAESVEYQALLQKYTAPELSDVYREGTVYRVKSPAEKSLQQSYGFEWARFSLTDTALKSCSGCGRHPTSMSENELWALADSRLFWCGVCKDQCPAPVVHHFPDRVMPRLMKQVILEVNEHPDFLQLNHSTRQMLGWLTQDEKRNSEDNRYIRDIWLFLYKGTNA